LSVEGVHLEAMHSMKLFKANYNYATTLPPLAIQDALILSLNCKLHSQLTT